MEDNNMLYNSGFKLGLFIINVRHFFEIKEICSFVLD